MGYNKGEPMRKQTLILGIVLCLTAIFITASFVLTPVNVYAKVTDDEYKDAVTYGTGTIDNAKTLDNSKKNKAGKPLNSALQQFVQLVLKIAPVLIFINLLYFLITKDEKQKETSKHALIGGAAAYVLFFALCQSTTAGTTINGHFLAKVFPAIKALLGG